jgi:hypothetical protein
MTNAQSIPSARERSVNWIFAGFVALGVVGSLPYMAGGVEPWFGVVVYALVASLLRRQHAYDPLWRLSEIGPIGIECPDCRPSSISRQNWLRRLYPFVFALFLIWLCIDAFSSLRSEPPNLTEAVIWNIALKFLGLLAYDALMYLNR